MINSSHSHPIKKNPFKLQNSMRKVNSSVTKRFFPIQKKMISGRVSDTSWFSPKKSSHTKGVNGRERWKRRIRMTSWMTHRHGCHGNLVWVELQDRTSFLRSSPLGGVRIYKGPYRQYRIENIYRHIGRRSKKKRECYFLTRLLDTFFRVNMYQFNAPSLSETLMLGSTFGKQYIKREENVRTNLISYKG